MCGPFQCNFVMQKCTKLLAVIAIFLAKDVIISA